MITSPPLSITDYTNLFKCRLDCAKILLPFRKPWTLFYLLWRRSLTLSTLTTSSYSWSSRRTYFTCLRRLTHLSDASATIKLKKCCFNVETVDYSRHFICPWRSEIASHTTDAICKLHPSTSAAEFRFFLGLCSVFLQFLPNFARIAIPLKKRQ